MFTRAKIIKDLALKTAAGSSRGLRTMRDSSGHAIPSGSEVVIAGPAAAAAILIAGRAQIKRDGFNAHQQVKLLTDRNWLEDVDSAHMSKRWGYGITAMTPPVKKLYEESGIGGAGLISWEDQKRFILDTREKLHTELGVEVIICRANIGDIEHVDQRFVVPITNSQSITPNGSSVIGSSVITVSDSSLFIQAAKGPDRLAFPGCKSIKALYNLDPKVLKEELEIGILYGVGLSSAWIVKHFPEIKFVLVKREADVPLTTDILGGWYQSPNVVGIVNLDGPNAAKMVINHNGGVDIRSPALPALMGKIHAYSAMGTEKPERFNDCVPVAQQIYLTETPLREIVSPSIIARESFHDSFYNYMKTVGHSHHLGVTTEEDFTSYIGEYVKKNGLLMSKGVMKDFTREFCERIKRLDHQPDGDEEVAIIVASYNACEPNLASRRHFESDVLSLKEGYTHRHDSKPPTSTSEKYKSVVSAIRSEGTASQDEATEATEAPEAPEAPRKRT